MLLAWPGESKQSSAAVDSLVAPGDSGGLGSLPMSLKERAVEKFSKGRQDAADTLAKTRQDMRDKIDPALGVVSKMRERLGRMPADAEKTLATYRSTLVRFMTDKMQAVFVSASSEQAGVVFFLASIGAMALLRRWRRISQLSAQTKSYSGSCHCGQVRFTVRAPRHVVAWDCNCSICLVKRNVHFVVPKEDFTLLPHIPQEGMPRAYTQVSASTAAGAKEGGDGGASTRYCGALTEYRFNTGVARHVFCSVCGVQAFYHPRSNPDGVGVTLACVQPFSQVESYEVRSFDGGNWEKNLVKSGIQGFSKAD
jgi:hypothetical protein